ncbi:MAG: PHB depolymerase family esterase [Bdellovibrionales bacterium]|nr:PHB depolymerase family esterase [Bdellovibrionales bacterium]
MNSKVLTLVLLFFGLGLQAVAEMRSSAFWWPTPLTSTAALTSGSYSNSAGSRDYLLFSPSTIPDPGKAGLVVVLHGCFQTGQQMADGTGFNAIAEEEGLYILYPEQTYAANPWKCWNWFKMENLQRDTGELSILSGMTQEIMEAKKIPSTRVFVTGLSAGAGMASNLLACYSDLFSGAAIHSGLEYMAATSEQEAHDVLKTGSSRDVNETGEIAYKCSPNRQAPLKVMAIHGTKDPFVNTINADRVVDQFIQVNDFIDDGRDNNSFKTTIQETRIPNEASKYPARVETYFHKKRPYMRKIWVEGMGHGWSGGSPVAPYMDPRGVNVSKEIVDFFF